MGRFGKFKKAPYLCSQKQKKDMRVKRIFTERLFRKQTGQRRVLCRNATDFVFFAQNLVKQGWGEAVLVVAWDAGTAATVKLRNVTPVFAGSVFSTLDKLPTWSFGTGQKGVKFFFDGVNTFCLKPSAAVNYESPQDFYAWVCEASLALPRGASLSHGKGSKQRNKYLVNVTLEDCERWAAEGEEIIV